MSNIEKKVVEGVKDMAQDACDLEKVAETVAVGTYKKIEETVVGGYKAIENTFVEGFMKISDAFVEKYLMKEGETLEEAKARIQKEQEELNKTGLNTGRR